MTLGESGKTVALASGASQSGFGRSGSVDWDTTAKTAGFTAVNGNGYFINTTSAAITVTLPASPSAGNIVAFRDYAQTFNTNNLTIGRNSQPIDGLATDFVVETKGTSVTLVYVDGTQGWKSVASNDQVNEPKFIAATGGTITTCGNFKIHSFTGPGTFCVSCGGNPAGSVSVDYLVVAGGGSGGSNGPGPGSNGAGGGAGGLRIGAVCAPSAPPLVTTALPVTVQGYPITVGAGASAGPSQGQSGSNSIFSTITSTGGGGGGAGTPGGSPPRVGLPGGSGGGSRDGTAGSGNTPPVSPPQGNDGGCGPYGGGGGAGSPGKGTPQVPSPAAGNVSAGEGFPVATVFGSAPKGFYLPDSPNVGVTACGTFAGGGGSGFGGTNATSRAGGPGGGGQSGNRVPAGNPAPAGTAGRTNSGGGGGAVGSHPDSGPGGSGGAGGSGIVLIRYKFQ